MGADLDGVVIALSIIAACLVVAFALLWTWFKVRERVSAPRSRRPRSPSGH